MPSKLLHCDPLFKKALCSHVHCHRSKRPCYFFSERLNAFLKKDVMENGKEYRICDNVCRLIKEKRFRRCTIVSSTVRDKATVVSKTKNMREIQEAYYLIVELEDPSL